MVNDECRSKVGLAARLQLQTIARELQLLDLLVNPYPAFSTPSKFEGFKPPGQGQNRALTVLYVPYRDISLTRLSYMRRICGCSCRPPPANSDSTFWQHPTVFPGRGSARAEDAQGTPIQSQISPSILTIRRICHI